MTPLILTYAQMLAQFRATANSYMFELTQEQLERAFYDPNHRQKPEDNRVLFDAASLVQKR